MRVLFDVRVAARRDFAGQTPLQSFVSEARHINGGVPQRNCDLDIKASDFVCRFGEKGEEAISITAAGDGHRRVFACAEEESTTLPSTIAEPETCFNLIARFNQVPPFGVRDVEQTGLTFTTLRRDGAPVHAGRFDAVGDDVLRGIHTG